MGKVGRRRRGYRSVVRNNEATRSEGEATVVFPDLENPHGQPRMPEGRKARECWAKWGGRRRRGGVRSL